MATSSLNSFEKKEKTALVNLAKTVGSALGTVAAKTAAVTKPARRRKAVSAVKAKARTQVRKAGREVKRQVAKARGQARKAARKVESTARKVRRQL
jgi:hypothetical protein